METYQKCIGVDISEHIKLDGELLTKIVNVGLNYMNVGVENGVNKILALMEKGQTSDDVSHFLKSKPTKVMYFIMQIGY